MLELGAVATILSFLIALLLLFVLVASPEGTFLVKIQFLGLLFGLHVVGSVLEMAFLVLKIQRLRFVEGGCRFVHVFLLVWTMTALFELHQGRPRELKTGR